jgi:putative Holliday junction resolvase
MFDLSKYESDSQSFTSKYDESEKGRLLALDIGDKRIGMAISDPLRMTAQGLPTFFRQSKKHDINFIRDIIERYGVTGIVYGLPKNMDGSLGNQAEKTEAFIKYLKSRINCPFIPWDERLTSRSAHIALMESGMSRKKRSKKVDMLSAILILQNYLDLSRRNTDKR